MNDIHDAWNQAGAGFRARLDEEARHHREKREARRRRRAEPHPEPEISQPTKLTTINVAPGQLDVLATKAEDALITAELPVFQRGGKLMRPAAWSVPASDERTTLAAGLQSIKVPALIDLLAQAATWTRYDGRGRSSALSIRPPMLPPSC
jgi:hypothetical protein